MRARFMRQKFKLLAAFAVCASLGFAAAHIGRRDLFLPPERPAEILLGPEALEYTGLDIPVQSESFYGFLAFKQDGSMLAARTKNGIELLDPRTGAKTLDIAHEGKTAVSFGFLHTRNALLSCDPEGIVRLWDLSTGKKMAEYPAGNGALHGMAISPDDSTALLVEEAGILSLLDLKNGSATALPAPAPTSVAAAGAYSPDGAQLAAAWTDGKITLYNAADRSVLSTRTWPFPEVTRLEFTPDGKKLVLSTREGKAYLLDAWETGAAPLPIEGKTQLLNGRLALIELNALKSAVFDLLKGTVTATLALNGNPVTASAAGPYGSSIALEEEDRILTFNINSSGDAFVFPAYNGKTSEEERNYYLMRERARTAFEKNRADTINATPDFLYPVAAPQYNPAKEAFEFHAAGLRLEARASFKRALDFNPKGQELTLSGKLRWKDINVYELTAPVLGGENGEEPLRVTPATGEPRATFPPAVIPPGRQRRSYETAISLYNAGHTGKALEVLEKLAREKYTPAMVGLAYFYSSGQVPGKDDGHALQLEREAEAAGNTQAQMRMGQRTLYGIRVTSSTARAAEYFAKAARTGNPEAAYWLGSTLALVKGTSVQAGQSAEQLQAYDLLQAAKWLRKSAEGSYAKGQFAYASILEAGTGVAQDMEDALEWYEKAAAQGLPDAMAALAQLYETGARAPKDTARALRLLTDAAKADKNFQPLLTAFLTRTKPEELRAALNMPAGQILPAPERMAQNLTTMPPDRLFGVRMGGESAGHLSARGAGMILLTVTAMLFAAVLFAGKKLPSCPPDLEYNTAAAGARHLKRGWVSLLSAVAKTLAERHSSAPAPKEESKTGEEAGKDKPENKDDTVLKISL